MLLKAIMLAMKKRGKPNVPYISIYDEEASLAEQTAVPDPGDPIEIGDDNDNDGRSQDQQECANNPDDDLFSSDSDDENDDNDTDEDNDPDDK